MKTRIYLIALFCFIAVNAFAQSGWQLLNPLPISCGLTSVQFLNSNTGYAVGMKGLVKTTNGGTNWTRLSDTGFYLSTYFVNASTGWISGDYIKKTTDGGTTWTIQQSLDNEYRCKLFFVNENTGWNVGSQTIYKTTDGGLNWNVNTGFGATNLYDVYFIDVNTGWISAGLTGIAKTTNGGNNWSVVSLTSSPYQMSFINANTGYAYCSDSKVIKTTDGGLSWNTVCAGLYNNARGIIFLNENTGWIPGHNNYTALVMKTTNGGVNWSVQKFVKSDELTSVSFSDINTGWMVGGKGEIIKTTNSGANWSYQSSEIVNTFLSVFFTDANTGFASGYWDTSIYFHSSIFKTTDGGYNWTPKSFDVPNSLWSVFFSGQNTGWCVGVNSRILKTTNAGENWFYQYPDSSTDFNSVYFVNQNTGWAGGSRILKTTNGGTNWFWQSNNIGNSLSFADANTGWALGYFADLSTTTNGGANWIKRDLPIWFQNYPSALQMLNSQTGYVVGGFSNVIFKSTNGGVNWFSIPFPINSGITVFFTDVNTGCISGDDKIAKTTNQGLNWTVSEYPSAQPVYSTYFINGNTGWAVGYGGLILKTTTGGVGINPLVTPVPDKYILYQNYPNPFNAVSRIRFEIPKSGRVKIEIHDVSGRLIDTPVNEYLRAGAYETNFDGNRLSSGVYFCRLLSGDYSQTMKMVLVK